MWNKSPVQVPCMRQGAQGWCTGMTLRDGMGREVEVGFRMGNTCTHMADSCECGAKSTTICKVISLQLKKGWGGRHSFGNRVLSSQSYSFSSSQYVCESWTIKKTECQIIGAFELQCWRRISRVPWTARSSNQQRKSVLNFHWKDWCWSWSSSTLATHGKNWVIRKDPDAWKDWRQEEKETTENEMIGWYHQLDGHEYEQVLEVGDILGSLVCCSPWGYRESNTTEQINWTDFLTSPMYI